MEEKFKNFIIINLKNEERYREKADSKLRSKFKGNFRLITHIKYVYIVINSDIKHIFSLKIEGNDLIEFKEDNTNPCNSINIEEILNIDSLEDYDGNVFCSSLVFDCNEENENIKFIEKFYNCDYTLAALSYKILSYASKNKINNKSSFLYWKNNKLYINSKIIKVILIMLKYLAFPMMANLLLSEFEIDSNFINFLVDILLVLIEKDFIIHRSNKTIVSEFKKFVKKHLKEILDIFKNKHNIKDFFDNIFK